MSPDRRAIERVESLCREHDEARSLCMALIDELRRVVEFDDYAWVLTDPATTVGHSPLADVPCLPELPRLIRLKYLTPLNRWTTLATPAVGLSAATGGALERSRLWSELLVDYQVRDIASAVFEDAYGCWSFLDLWRRDPQVPFTSDEVDYLAMITVPITRAIRRCHATTFLTASAPRPPTGPLVLVLSADLDLRTLTADTDAYLRRLVPPDDGRAPIPAAAYNVAAQLLASEAGVDAHPPSARVHLADGLWLTMHAARIGDGESAAHLRDIAVTIETASTSDRLDLLARATGLTDREGELLAHLTTGADTRSIAARMFVSEHTVQDHLKSVFAKTGIRTRRLLVARVTAP